MQPTKLFSMGIWVLPFQRPSVIMPPALRVWRTRSSNSAGNLLCPRGDKSAFLPALEAVGWGVGGIVLVGVEPHLDSHETDEVSPVSLSSSTARCQSLDFPLLHSARTSVSAPRLFARPLLPSPRPSVRALFLYRLTSLAGHWFGFAVPTLSLGGASVVAEENRYPFYVFIISQIKKTMN